MPAATSDMFSLASSGTAPLSSTLTASKTIGAPSIAVTATSGWPTSTLFHFKLYQAQTLNNVTTPIGGTETLWSGIISGLNIGSLTLRSGTDQVYPINTIIEPMLTSAQYDNLINGLLSQHNQNGSHGAVTATSLAVTNGVTAASVATTTLTINGKDSSQLTPTGILSPFAGSAAPAGWLLCDGSAVSRTTYSGLFAVTSTTYGAGDGTTTFNLPDMRGRAAVGADPTALRNPANNTLGQTGGVASVALSIAEMPVHNHGVTDPGHSHNLTGSNRSNLADTLAGGVTWANRVDTRGDGMNGTGSNISINNAGSGAAHTNMQPYSNVNFIIKT